MSYNGKVSSRVPRSIGSFRSTGASFPQPCMHTAPTTFAGWSANVLRAAPLMIHDDCHTTAISIKISSGAGTGSLCRLGIYSNTANDVYPGALLVDAGEVAIDGTGAMQLVINQTLAAGTLIWPVSLLHISSGSLTPYVRTYPASLNMLGVDLTGANSYTGVQTDYTYGVLPSTFPAGTYTVGGRPDVELTIIF